MPQNESFSDIVKRLQDNDPSLTHVFLHGHGLGDQEMGELAQALRGNTHAVDVAVTSNPHITAQGVAILIDALKDNKTLAELYVPPIGGKKALDLGRALSNTGNKNLVFFGINNGKSWNFTDKNKTAAIELMQKMAQGPNTLTATDRESVRDRLSSIVLLMDIMETENGISKRGEDYISAIEPHPKLSSGELVKVFGVIQEIAASYGKEFQVPESLEQLLKTQESETAAPSTRISDIAPADREQKKSDGREGRS